MGPAGNAYELEEKEVQQQLTEALAVSIHLEAFPKAVLEAYVQVLQDEGGVLASALTCISLALADAGVMLYDMVSACEAVRHQHHTHARSAADLLPLSVCACSLFVFDSRLPLSRSPSTTSCTWTPAPASLSRVSPLRVPTRASSPLPPMRR